MAVTTAEKWRVIYWLAIHCMFLLPSHGAKTVNIVFVLRSSFLRSYDDIGDGRSNLESSLGTSLGLYFSRDLDIGH